ncbi:MAG: GHMP kinase [Planctomycetaceae bacterium]|nr:MAG: GHMP kinase [Planctomycetaceae bacterium]
MRIIRQRAYARAGLVGNPSDGYNGKTISVIVKNFWAEVTMYEWERIELLPSQEDHSRFDSIDELVEDVDLHGYYGGLRLIKATVKRFAEFCRAQEAAGRTGFELSRERFAVRYTSNIPRQVGLAGSSAIIVATLRALMEFYRVTIPQSVLPSLALSIEKEELGISAGLQDRVIQVYGGVVFMDFALEKRRQEFGYDCYAYEPLDPGLLPPLYLAYTRERSEPTEVVHNPLRARYDRGDPEVVRAMGEFAGFAAEAREALLGRQVDRLAELMNRNFDLRRQIIPLAPNHVKMIETARAAGASAKYCGSGGAIIGTYTGESMYHELKRSLEAIHCSVLRPIVE